MWAGEGRGLRTSKTFPSMRIESSLERTSRPPGPGDGPREGRGDEGRDTKGDEGREPAREDGREPKMGIVAGWGLDKFGQNWGWMFGEIEHAVVVWFPLVIWGIIGRAPDQLEHHNFMDVCREGKFSRSPRGPSSGGKLLYCTDAEMVTGGVNIPGRNRIIHVGAIRHSK